MSTPGKILALIALLVTSVFLQPSAQAHPRHREWSRHSRHERHDNSRRPYPEYGQIKVVFPGRLITVVIGGSRYFYCDGVYYRRDRHGYVVIPPPIDCD